MAVVFIPYGSNRTDEFWRFFFLISAGSDAGIKKKGFRKCSLDGTRQLLVVCPRCVGGVFAQFSLARPIDVQFFFECYESADTGKPCNSIVFESNESENTGQHREFTYFSNMRGGNEGKTYVILHVRCEQSCVDDKALFFSAADLSQTRVRMECGQVRKSGLKAQGNTCAQVQRCDDERRWIVC